MPCHTRAKQTLLSGSASFHQSPRCCLARETTQVVLAAAQGGQDGDQKAAQKIAGLQSRLGQVQREMRAVQAHLQQMDDEGQLEADPAETGLHPCGSCFLRVVLWHATMTVMPHMATTSAEVDAEVARTVTTSFQHVFALLRVSHRTAFPQPTKAFYASGLSDERLQAWIQLSRAL